jgi:hypothetical protein
MTVLQPLEYEEENELMCDNVLRKVSSRQPCPCPAAAAATPGVGTQLVQMQRNDIQ